MKIRFAMAMLSVVLFSACDAGDVEVVDDQVFAASKKDKDPPPSCPLPGDCSGSDIIINGSNDPVISGGGSGGGQAETCRYRCLKTHQSQNQWCYDAYFDAWLQCQEQLPSDQWNTCLGYQLGESCGQQSSSAYDACLARCP